MVTGVLQKYKVGDCVCVLPFDEIRSQFCGDSLRTLPSGCHFAHSMEEYCGKKFTVERLLGVNEPNSVGYYKLEGVGHWTFTDEMLEHIPEVQVVDGPVIAFDDLMGY